VASRLHVVVGEDDVLLRAGICRVLEEAGIEVVAQAGDADDLLRRALAHRPDVTVTDVQMPPCNEDDGLRAALELRRQRSESHVLVLSQRADQQYLLDLVGDEPAGVGYLLKERVGDVETFVDAVERVAQGGTALDAEVVALMLGAAARRTRWLRPRSTGRAALVTARESPFRSRSTQRTACSISRYYGASPASACLSRKLLSRSQRRIDQDFKNASRSVLIVSASVVGMPCGNPGYDLSVPFGSSLADRGPASA
jgi:DNA-binding NarL/FixJ family response regulator